MLRRSIHRFTGAILLAAASAWVAPPNVVLAQSSHAAGRQVPASLSARMTAFLQAIRDDQSTRIPGFFPSTGSFTYVLTVHGEAGDSSSVLRFTPAQKARAFRYGGILWASMNLDFESQGVGLLAHQVMCRGVAWRPVSPTRFVPPGSAASSPIFVEWRRDGSKWVIASLGDEAFARDPLPEWVC